VPFPDADARLVGAEGGDVAEGEVAVGGRTVATAGVGWQPPEGGEVLTGWRARRRDDGFEMAAAGE
jgi:hypothetical protein